VDIQSVTSVAVITPDAAASAKTEPWGQVAARLLSPEGAVVGLSYAPSVHP